MSNYSFYLPLLILITSVFTILYHMQLTNIFK
nr:MAG TPA: hypothetical protein [Caudoviricetes sp.]